MPSLILDTKTLSLPSASSGVGNGSSQYSIPSKLLIASIADSLVTSFSKTAEQNVPCPVFTPTLAFEGSTIRSSIESIFLDSFTNFISSSEYPFSNKFPATGITFFAIGLE